MKRNHWTAFSVCSDVFNQIWKREIWNMYESQFWFKCKAECVPTSVSVAWTPLLVGDRPPLAVPGCWVGAGVAWPGPGWMDGLGGGRGGEPRCRCHLHPKRSASDLSESWRQGGWTSLDLECCKDKKGQYITWAGNSKHQWFLVLGNFVGLPGPHSPVWLVLALPLTFEDPLPNILRSVGGI